MRNYLHQIPLLRVVIPLIIGIWLQLWVYHSASAPGLAYLFAGLFAISFLSAALYGLLDITRQYQWRALNGVAIAVMVFAFGYLLAWFYNAPNHGDYFKSNTSAGAFYIVKIIEPAIEKEKTINAIVEVTEVQQGDQRTKTGGKVFINFLKNETSLQLKYGDVIAFNAIVKAFDPPMNPGEFNYQRYQAHHNIYYRTYLTPGDWKRVASSQGSIVFTWVYALREKFLRVISNYVKDKNDFGVASALMLGYRDYMNDDIMQAYADSGVLHVLSVSGLHVAIMFFMLNFILSGMDNKGRRYAILKTLIVIGIIWFYTCLTGLSPSVLRAAMMLSMVAAGQLVLRNANIYNILAGSALILILFNPFIVADVGFWLSYLAVTGIVFFHPKIAPLIIIGTGVKPAYKNAKWFLKPLLLITKDLKWFALKILDGCWQIVAISIAAQIATLPLTLYFFHQFPTLFLISNLIVIPVSNLILYLGTALFALSSIPYLSNVLGWLFSHALGFLNLFVFGIDQLPAALIEGISINLPEVILLYLLIGLCAWLMEEKRTTVVIAAVSIVLLLCVYNTYEHVQQSAQNKIAVYDVRKQKAIAFIRGQKALHEFDGSLLKDQRSMRFHINNHWWQCGVSKTDTINYRSLPIGKLVLSSGRKILMIDSAAKTDYIIEHKLKVDLLILSHSPKLSLQNLQKLFDFKEVVFDSSNSPRRIAEWKAFCTEKKIKFWDVVEQGAYVADLN